MKTLLLLVTIFSLTLFANAQIVNIPDFNFKTRLVADLSINTNGDGEIQVSEASVADTILVNSSNISDLTGIEAFTALTYLDCSFNQSYLAIFDLSNNVALTYLNCYGNQLTSLDVSNNPALTHLICYTNQISSLDLSNNAALVYLNCEDNQLSGHDFSNNPALTHLNCSSNQLTSLDVSNNSALTHLNCSANQISSLDLSNNPLVTDLRCGSNNLTTLDVSTNTALWNLQCGNNQLSSLDVSSNTAISNLVCKNNQLSSLNLNNNIALTYIKCSDNQLSSLKIKNGNNAAIPEWNFNSRGNPNLYCIEVDDSIWSAAHWPDRDPQSYFSDNCDYTGVSDELQSPQLSIFPNPTTGKVIIEADEVERVEILNLQGKQIYIGTETHIDLSQEAQGIYIIKVLTYKQAISSKLIKQ